MPDYPSCDVLDSIFNIEMKSLVGPLRGHISVLIGFNFLLLLVTTSLCATV